MDSPNMQAGVPAPKKNNTTMIIVAVVAIIVLCCCCLAVGGFAYSRYAASKALTNFNNQFPSTSLNNSNSSPSVPSGSTAGVVPTGGLGDEVARTTAWGYALSAIVQNDPTSCPSPDAEKTTIEVTQKPDSSGAWKERWTVACGGSASSIPVDVAFTPAGGGVFNVTATVAK